MSLIISRSLVLSQPAGGGGPISLNAPVIGWQNYVAFGTVSATSEDGLYPLVNLTNDSTALEWRAADSSNQDIVVALPPGAEVDYVGIAVHNLGSINANISIIANAALGPEVVMEPVALGRDDPAILRFTPTTTDQITVRIENPTGVPFIAVLYVGKLMLFPRNIYVGHTPINYGRRIEVSSGRNEKSDFLGRIVTSRSKTTQVQMMNIPPDWYRTEMVPFEDHAEEYPFFWAWRPRDYPMEVGYCWLTDDVQMSNQLNNGFVQFEMSMSGIAGRAGIPMVPKDPGEV